MPSRNSPTMKREFHVPYISRRSFLQRFGAAALGTTVLARTIRELRLPQHRRGPGRAPERLQGADLRFPQRRQRFQQPDHPHHPGGVGQLRGHPLSRARHSQYRRRPGHRARDELAQRPEPAIRRRTITPTASTPRCRKCRPSSTPESSPRCSMSARSAFL